MHLKHAARNTSRNSSSSSNNKMKRKILWNIHWVIQLLYSLLTYDDDFGFFTLQPVQSFYFLYLHWIKMCIDAVKFKRFSVSTQNLRTLGRKRRRRKRWTLFALLNPKHTKYEIMCATLKWLELFEKSVCVAAHMHDGHKCKRHTVPTDYRIVCMRNSETTNIVSFPSRATRPQIHICIFVFRES